MIADLKCQNTPPGGTGEAHGGPLIGGGVTSYWSVQESAAAIDIVDVLTDLFIFRGPASFIRSNNGPSLPPKRFGTGFRQWVQRQPISNQGHLGRVDIVRASMHSSGASCLLAKSSTHERKRKSLSKNGGTITIHPDHIVFEGIDLPHPKRSFQ